MVVIRLRAVHGCWQLYLFHIFELGMKIPKILGTAHFHGLPFVLFGSFLSLSSDLAVVESPVSLSIQALVMSETPVGHFTTRL